MLRETTVMSGFIELAIYTRSSTVLKVVFLGRTFDDFESYRFMNRVCSFNRKSDIYQQSRKMTG